jgi:hypothetical protein
LGNPVDLVLSTRSRDDLPDCAATAKLLLKDAERWQAEAEKTIIENLYELWVEEWRPEGNADPVQKGLCRSTDQTRDHNL